jgi:hypothetical protein
MNTSRSKIFVGAIILTAFFGLGISERTSAQQPADPFKDPAAMTKVTADWMGGKLSSPGVSVEIKETDRSTDGGQLKVQYHVFVKGAPKELLYTFSAWPINAAGPVDQMKGLSLMPDGLVVCAGRLPGQCGQKEQPDDPVDFTFAGKRRSVSVRADFRGRRMESVFRDGARSDYQDGWRVQCGSDSVDAEI